MCDGSAAATHCCFLDGLAPSKTCPHVFLVLPLLQLLSGHKTQAAVPLRRLRIFYTLLISSFKIETCKKRETKSTAIHLRIGELQYYLWLPARKECKVLFVLYSSEGRKNLSLMLLSLTIRSPTRVQI